MIRDSQDLADERAAEQGYLETLAHPETIVDAFELLSVPIYFLCVRACGRRTSRGTADRCSECIKAEAGVALSKLLREHPEAFDGLLKNAGSDELEYGPRCMFCGNRAAVCRCGDA
jgi:hypothetical protein